MNSHLIPPSTPEILVEYSVKGIVCVCSSSLSLTTRFLADNRIGVLYPVYKLITKAFLSFGTTLNAATSRKRLNYHTDLCQSECKGWSSSHYSSNADHAALTCWTTKGTGMCLEATGFGKLRFLPLTRVKIENPSAFA